MNDQNKDMIPNNIPASELLKLDNQLCFALYVCSKEVIRKYKPLLDPLHLTYTGYITMLALWEEDEITVKKLGERLTLDSGTLTPLLKKLEQQGYVQRTRSKTDERNICIKLTEKGAALKEKAAHVPSELVCSTKLDTKKALELRFALQELSRQLLGTE